MSDTIAIPESNALACENNNLWIQHDTAWFISIDKNSGNFLDSIIIQIPDTFKGAYQCKDMCFHDSAFYSLWAYCWCGHYRLLKTEFKTGKTIDMGDVPLYNSMLVMNDTVWAGGNKIYPLLKDDELCTNIGMIGDTLINSKTYQKIYSLTDTIVSEENIDQYTGAIREEGKRIFRINPSSSKEELVFDFSKNVNDTILFDNTFVDPMPLKLMEIDRVSLNGRMHLRYRMNLKIIHLIYLTKNTI